MTDLRQCEVHRIAYWHPSGCPMCKIDTDQIDLARTLAETRRQLADALEAAKRDADMVGAMMAERAAQEVKAEADRWIKDIDPKAGERSRVEWNMACAIRDKVVTAIRALTPTGLADLQALRAERDTWREGSRVQAEEKASLAAELAEARAQVAGLRKAAGNAAMYLDSGFINCQRCGEEVPTKHTDAEHELRAALTPAEQALFEQSMAMRQVAGEIAKGQDK